MGGGSSDGLGEKYVHIFRYLKKKLEKSFKFVAEIYANAAHTGQTTV